MLLANYFAFQEFFSGMIAFKPSTNTVGGSSTLIALVSTFKQLCNSVVSSNFDFKLRGCQNIKPHDIIKKDLMIIYNPQINKVVAVRNCNSCKIIEDINYFIENDDLYPNCRKQSKNLDAEIFNAFLRQETYLEIHDNVEYTCLLYLLNLFNITNFHISKIVVNDPLPIGKYIVQLAYFRRHGYSLHFATNVNDEKKIYTFDSLFKKHTMKKKKFKLKQASISYSIGVEGNITIDSFNDIAGANDLPPIVASEYGWTQPNVFRVDKNTIKMLDNDYNNLTYKVGDTLSQEAFEHLLQQFKLAGERLHKIIDRYNKGKLGKQKRKVYI